MSAPKILEADHHRNGVMGEGFYVGIIKDNDGSRKLVVFFPEYADADGETLAAHQARVAVLDLDLAATGNIYMHPTEEHAGDNAWRGDRYGNAARDLIAEVRHRHDLMLERLREQGEQGEQGDPA
jgi:hypothetical protein